MVIILGTCLTPCMEINSMYGLGLVEAPQFSVSWRESSVVFCGSLEKAGLCEGETGQCI